MISFGGVDYYISLNAVNSLLTGDEDLQAKEITETEVKEFLDEKGQVTGSEKITRTHYKGKEVDGAKFEIINMMLQIVLGDMEPMDDTLGEERAFKEKPLSYKIAFNTLKGMGILKEIEE